MASQDWFEKDFYQTLGVPKTADAATLKKSYRKLARTYHPDQNPGDKAAETRFKEIGEAYAVLSDPKEREEYDAVRQMASGGARFAQGAGGSARNGGGFEDLFSGLFGGGGGGGNIRFGSGGNAPGGGPDLDGLFQMFGGGGAARGSGFTSQPVKGVDLTAVTTLSFRQAAIGEKVTLRVSGSNITIRIPAGVSDGQKIRLAGKGQVGAHGGPAGDMIISVTVTPHPVFTIEGNNLRVKLPVTFPEAALGATVEVPTFTGDPVRVKVSPGTPAGRILRVKGRGITTKAGTGDLLAEIEVEVPSELCDAAKTAVLALQEATESNNPRIELFARARE